MSRPVYLVDDDEDFRLAVCTLLRTRVPMVSVVGDAADGEEALVVVRRERPTVVVTDLIMPLVGWIFGGVDFSSKFILLGSVPDGIAAVLCAPVDPVLIAAAARLAASGYRISAGAAGASHHPPGEAIADADESADRLPVHLSPREAEVLALLAEGAPNKVIARRLGISVHTVKFHVAALLVKLGAANRTDAIATAMRQGLVLV